MTKNNIDSIIPVSLDRHPQSENHIKIVAIICVTIIVLSLLAFVSYFYKNGDQEFFQWLKSILTYGAGMCSGIGLTAFKPIYKLIKKDY